MIILDHIKEMFFSKVTSLCGAYGKGDQIYSFNYFCLWVALSGLKLVKAFEIKIIHFGD